MKKNQFNPQYDRKETKRNPRNKKPYLSPPIDMMFYALKYASRGWYVLPLHNIVDGECSCGETRVKCSKGKHPRTDKGHLGATLDVDLIKEWWTNWPDANIGIVVGPMSDLAVLDIDPRNGGNISFASLILAYCDLPVTVQVITGGGGAHYYFKYNNLFGIPKEFKKGIDIKRSGYVVAPPSNHESGGVYEWMPDQGPSEIELAEVPDFLRIEKVGYTPQVGSSDGNSMDHLNKLSGAPEVNGEVFTYRQNADGTHQIVVNGKLTGCWIDNNGYIGSHDRGGPTVIQWIQWYGR